MYFKPLMVSSKAYDLFDDFSVSYHWIQCWVDQNELFSLKLLILYDSWVAVGVKDL